VRGVEGDHSADQVKGFQQWTEGGRLVGLGSHLPLGQSDGGAVGDGGQQVPVALGSVRGTGQRLAVHRDRRPRRRAGGADGGVVAFGQVGADRGVQGIAVEGGQEPGEGGMGRGAATSGQVTADADLFLQRGGGALSPLGDLGDGPGARDDCAGADQQQADQGIPPPATRTRVG
jgi:hypothetical protein